jgi:hypothetical protein
MSNDSLNLLPLITDVLFDYAHLAFRPCPRRLSLLSFPFSLQLSLLNAPFFVVIIVLPSVFPLAMTGFPHYYSCLFLLTALLAFRLMVHIFSFACRLIIAVLKYFSSICLLAITHQSLRYSRNNYYPSFIVNRF